MGQDLYVSPSTIEDTLDMEKAGWPYPNLSYLEVMAMIQNISFPTLLGKELNDRVMAWKETRKYELMFNQASCQRELSLRFTTEATLFKQHQTYKYINANSQKLDRPLIEVSSSLLKRHLLDYIKFGME